MRMLIHEDHLPELPAVSMYGSSPASPGKFTRRDGSPTAVARDAGVQRSAPHARHLPSPKDKQPRPEGLTHPPRQVLLPAMEAGRRGLPFAPPAQTQTQAGMRVEAISSAGLEEIVRGGHGYGFPKSLSTRESRRANRPQVRAFAGALPRLMSLSFIRWASASLISC